MNRAAFRRALIVEDEVLVAMYAEDLLIELGFEVADIAMNLEQALSVARLGNFDFAVLDVNVGGQLSFPVADVLRERGIPFFFASGYGSGGFTEEYSEAVRVQKPYLAKDLMRSIEVIARPRE